MNRRARLVQRFHHTQMAIFSFHATKVYWIDKQNNIMFSISSIQIEMFLSKFDFWGVVNGLTLTHELLI
jgi:hypothetical protein